MRWPGSELPMRKLEFLFDPLRLVVYSPFSQWISYSLEVE